MTTSHFLYKKRVFGSGSGSSERISDLSQLTSIDVDAVKDQMLTAACSDPHTGGLLKGSTRLSHESMTLWSGILAVISVNIVIAFYIYMAMKEPSDKHQPDPKFLADAKASIMQTRPSEVGSLSDRAKQE